MGFLLLMFAHVLFCLRNWSFDFMEKVCRFSGFRCYFTSCDFIDSIGDVHLCVHHRNPLGWLMKRKVVCP